jgi:hypothetical protein
MLQIPKPEKIDPRLARDLSRVRSGSRESSRRFRVELRASSFPICPRKYHIYRRLAPHKRPFEAEKISSEVATLPGTALHLVLQKWFGVAAMDHCYGNWECLRCSTPEDPVVKKYAFGVQTCDRCGSEMAYKEFEIKKARRVPFEGHIDMILWYRESDFAVILDYKGSSAKKMKLLKEAGAKPNNYMQINAYANAINLGEQDVGDLKKIDKAMLIYFDRGDAIANQLAFQYPVSVKTYHETIALIAAAKRSLKEMMLPRGLCNSISDDEAYWCPVKNMCFSPLLETMLEGTIQPVDDGVRDRTLEKRLVTLGENDV